jgi:hypothetical protein
VHEKHTAAIRAKTIQTQEIQPEQNPFGNALDPITTVVPTAVRGPGALRIIALRAMSRRYKVFGAALPRLSSCQGSPPASRVRRPRDRQE